MGCARRARSPFFLQLKLIAGQHLFKECNYEYVSLISPPRPINSYFSFFLCFQISSVSGFRLCSVAPENIAVGILSLNSFVLKTLKEVQLKCKMCDLYSYTGN